MSKLPAKPQTAEVAAFLRRLEEMPAVRPASGRRGRLIFAVDATASRQPAWDRACHLQAEMFLATRDLGGLAVQLAYWRGYMEFAATPFLTDTADLARRMAGVSVMGGQTQVLRCLEHALAETKREKVNALVLVGDAFEEAVDPACHVAGQLGLHGTPVFCFLEGRNAAADFAFRQIARVSGGAFAPFDADSAETLRALLRAVAVFAAGGRAALARLPGREAARIAGQLPAPGAVAAMAWLALGAASLLIGLLLLYAFANASAAAVKKTVVWGLAGVGTVMLAVMLATGRGLSTLVWTGIVFGPAIMQGWRAWRARRAFSRPAPGGEASGVETATLEMRLDLGSGAMSGRVRRGAFAGRELSEMTRAELLSLMGDCAANDPESVALIEAWLDRTEPGWREAPPPAASGPMTREEALSVLGLSEGATEAEIRAAHRRLMQSAHPDRGGSDWLAARINEARSVLLG